MPPKISMYLNIGFAVLGALLGCGAQFTTLFGSGITSEILAGSGIGIAILAAVNGTLHGYSTPVAGPLSNASPPTVSPAAKAVLALLAVLSVALIFGAPAHAQGIGCPSCAPYQATSPTAPVARAAHHKRPASTSIPLPAARPVFDAAPDNGAPTVAQANQNPLLVLQQFTVADLQAALADAKAQTPPDTTAANCYTALIPFVQSQAQNPLPQGAGAFQLLQKARDAKAYIANIQSPTGPLAGLNQACAPLVLDVQNTLVTLGVTVGVIANPAGATATLAGLPAAVAAFLNLPKLP